MKQNPLLTTMSTSMFNFTDNTSKNLKRKNSTNTRHSPSPNRQNDNSRSISMRSSHLMDLSRSPSASMIKRDNSLYNRLYNQAKELKEKIETKKNEFIDNMRRESIPKIHEVSKKIERKADLFSERLYPYHKLCKVDTDPDNSFEYAHVATVMSNPLGISRDNDNDDFTNNIDNIFCDNEEIKNLYGNKPAYVKIYRGIKHPKKQEFSFKPTLTKNTNRIIEEMKNASIEMPLRKTTMDNRSNISRNNNNSSIINNNDNSNFTNEIRNGNLIDLTADNINNNNKFNGENNYKENDNSQSLNFSNLNEFSPIKKQKNDKKIKNYYNTNDNNPYKYIHKLKNNGGNPENSDSCNQMNIYSMNESPIKERKIKQNPVENIKNRFKMELKKSYATNIYGSNPIKKERINQKSINISNKLYNEGLNSLKKKEKINEEKIQEDLMEYKKHSFKPNVSNSNNPQFQKTESDNGRSINKNKNQENLLLKKSSTFQNNNKSLFKSTNNNNNPSKSQNKTSQNFFRKININNNNNKNNNKNITNQYSNTQISSNREKRDFSNSISNKVTNYNTKNSNSISNFNSINSSLRPKIEQQNADNSSLYKTSNGSFYDKCRKWKENKDTKANYLREEKLKDEHKKCSFSPMISKSKKFFEEKLNFKEESPTRSNNEYVNKSKNFLTQKEQEKIIQSKIFGEISKSKKIITKPQEPNFSKLVSRKSNNNTNNAKIMHRAESVKNYRDKLSTNIFFKKNVYEVEENIDNKTLFESDKNKNMNINLNVNIMFDGKKY